MSDDEGMQFSRRSVLAGTAALGLAGTSTAVAKEFGKGEFADHDDSMVDLGTDAWPQTGFDNGRTYFYGEGSGPTGELTGDWFFEGNADLAEYPLVAYDTVYTFTGYPEAGTEKLVALDAADGSKKWSRNLTTDDSYGGYGTDQTVIADGEVYLTRNGHTEVYTAVDGTKRWEVEHGGGYPMVTDEMLVVEGNNVDDGAVTTAKITGISRTDGSIQWEYDFDQRGDALPAAASGSVYAAGSNPGSEENSKVVSLDAATGEEEWTTEVGPNGYTVATNTVIFVETDAAVNALDAETGEKMWSKSKTEFSDDQDPSLTFQAVGETTAYVTVDSMLYALDARSGEQQWSAEMHPNAWGVVVVGDVLYYAVDKKDDSGSGDPDAYDEIHLRNPNTGELIAKRTVPDVTGDRPDGDSQLQGYLAPVDGTIYTVSENALVAFREGENDAPEGGSDDGTDDDSDGNDDGSSGGDGSGSDDSGGSDGDSDGSDDSNDDC
ncbi:outer membrane protein assembly factor BamB family protein [Halorussus halophilus]|uniref:outer membrane protein assembly factor BamB family protein n=1 Tax=Halorussus halophilus TaxID=2650975 RepID=UPI0013019741|nr:PQQ-like beta-propeller repeat protein [Halorussus halophilus]